jgi:carboxypeptidase family protein
LGGKYIEDSKRARLCRLAGLAALLTVAANGVASTFVVDTGNSRILKFTSQGHLVTTWGGSRTNPREFDSSRGTPADVAGADAYEPDDTIDEAAWLGLREIQAHNFHVAGDEDWGAFLVEAPEIITLRATEPGNPTVSRSDVRLELFDSQGTKVDENSVAAPDLIVLVLTTDLYYVRVTHRDPEASGAETMYDLHALNEAGAELPGTILGVVLIANTEAPVAEADVTIDAGLFRSFVFTSSVDGSFIIPGLPAPNTYTLTAEKPDFEQATAEASLTEGEFKQVTIYLEEVADSEPPTAVCKDISVNLPETGTLTVAAEDLDGGSTDNVGIAAMTIEPATFTCAELGANPVTLTVYDAAGHSDSCESTVTVENPLDVCGRADVDGSGDVDAVDIQNVINAALGLPVVFDCDVDRSGGDVNATDVQLVIVAALTA